MSQITYDTLSSCHPLTINPLQDNQRGSIMNSVSVTLYQMFRVDINNTEFLKVAPQVDVER